MLKITKTLFLSLLVGALNLQIIVLISTSCTKEGSDNQKNEALIFSLINDINSDSLEADVLWLQKMGTRFALSNDRRNVAIRLKNRFIQMGYSKAIVDSFFVTKTIHNIEYDQWQYNIIAYIEGTTYPDSLCIIGGHYDNILKSGNPFILVPGANDNASGVAAAMEIARVMKKDHFSPKSSILFIAFGSEEIGLLGSSVFADSLDEFSQKIKFMLNNDMIAYEPEHDPSFWRVNIIDYDNSHNLRADAEKICVRYTNLNFNNDNTYNQKSDSYPFFANGYKALYFSSNKIDPNYHTLNDVVTNCNFNYCCEIVKISCALLVNAN